MNGQPCSKAKLRPTGHGVIQQLWTAVLQTQPATFGEQTSHESDVDGNFEHDPASAAA